MYQEQLNHLESLRKKAKNGVLIIIAVIVGGILIGLFSGHFLLIPVAIIAGIIVYFVAYKNAYKEYVRFFKNEFIAGLIRGLIPDAVYEPNSGFDRQMISGTGLMMMGNIYHSEDYIRGSYDGVPFERADVLIQDESTDSDGNTSTTTYFRGRWMVFESNKNTSADLQIIGKGFGYARRKKGIFTRKAERRHVLKTEDESFNKKFDVLCQDDSEAFYLLTPAVMQSLMNLLQRLDGKVMVGFVDNRVHVAVNSGKDSLEPSLFRAFSEKDMAEVQNEIQAITTFVKGLKLDRRIYQ